jgi:hypothetical protein
MSRRHPLTAPVEGCAVCVKDGFEDCNQHEDCEGIYCNGDDDGHATSSREFGWIDLGPVCLAEYRRRAAKFDAWESAGDYARDAAKDRLGW